MSVSQNRKDPKKKNIIQRQKPMNRMLFALTPLVLASVFFFGWRAFALLVLVNVAGFLSEYAFTRVYNTRVSSAVFVTNFLFALSLPPRIPFWIAVVGIVFGVVFGKMVFGGFGKNIFNPAISGRAFIYISFGNYLTTDWYQPVSGMLGGFARWQPDTVAQATPLGALQGGIQGAESFPVWQLLAGNISGSIGETCKILIILAGLYLLFSKTASFRIVLSALLAFVLSQAVFWALGLGKALRPDIALLTGSILYGIFFMATDPVSASQTTHTGRWIYGGFVGIMAGLIRVFSIWPESITFAILLGNMFAPLLDTLLKQGIGKRERAA